MNTKIIVKVMNFHALIRVDNARKKAEKYLQLEKEASNIIDMIVNNRNFILDKKLWEVDPAKPVLNIYFGSDYGFCGGINFQVNQLLDKDKDSDKIIIGKKIHGTGDGIVLKLAREEFITRYEEIEAILENSIRKREHSEINLIYNHFNNTSSIEIKKKKIFPFPITSERKDKYKEDYYVEGNANTILINLVTSYLNYEIKIAEVNSYASENIMRQNATSESLKKIEEREEQLLTLQRKIKTQKEFDKVIDSYTKRKGLKGDRK
ncbi:F0F1 ATP synthase subunit gamma [Lachnospiraceae bacterium MD1]|jgi:ATP synthase F1 gamma subunit|uniref:F0F1 ATP synthase subunit gamma n=1 Tax=Variimorphobacter saccharofermentans TaxID=2755051 RepID=A0A839JYJ6_9FIRM|nr:FoF1 ATP synthase subunit gamma [Variimorphobacter saccharofermentans]MBB2182287.1 F0F1 ATP synthase subunit gamma [Variimorphobacter saccharofermentans]